MSVVVDASNRDLRSVSAEIKELVGEGPVTVQGADRLHGLVAGFSSGEITILGNCGNYLGVLNDGANIRIEGNAGRYLADNMTEGEVVVNGDGDYGVGQYCYGGTIFVRGDAGDFTWEPGGYLTVQWSTGRWGVSADYVRAGDAVEVRIGQGAKPGVGGHPLGAKVMEEAAVIRGIPIGTDALSPCRYYDVHDLEDIKRMVTFLRDVTEYKVPILFKLGLSRPYDDIRACVEAGADAISIDGLVGGTGCSPTVVTQGVGIPTVALIPPAVHALKEMGVHRKVKLFILGGIRNGLDAYKSIALGADGVGFGAAAEITMGCRACICHTGRCLYGITSQDPELRARLDPVEAGQRLANFIKSTGEELKMLTMLSGHGDIKELSPEDLRAMDINTAAITGLKLVGFEKALPWWENENKDHPIQR